MDVATRAIVGRLRPRRDERQGAAAGILHQLGVALRVNLSAVLPLSLLLLLLSSEPSWTVLGRAVLVLGILTNTSYAFLSTFYHLGWLRFEVATPWRYALLVVVVLPLLGAAAMVTGRFLMGLVPSLMPSDPSLVLSTGLLVTVLYGLAFFTIEDARRGRRLVVVQLADSRQRENESRRARRAAELLTLQALMKPHFLFNTLSSIATLIHEDPPMAEETTLRLARLLRHVLEMGEGSMVTLETELGVVRAYLEIEKVRLGRRLRCEIDVPDDLLPMSVPGMLLQPLVENAVTHGVSQRESSGYVHVRARADGPYYVVEVIDNGPGFSNHRGCGQSSRLLRERLDHLYAGDFELSLSRHPERGETSVRLRLPTAAPPGRET